MAVTNSCPSSLFTSRHFQHSPFWTVSGHTIPTLCIACALERLENHKNELNVVICQILQEMACQIKPTATHFINMLSSDNKIIEHVCSVLVGLLSDNDCRIIQNTLQVITNITLEISKASEMVISKCIKIVTTTNAYSSAVLGYLTLVGQLVHDSPSLATTCLTSDSFMNYLINGLSFNEKEEEREKIISSIVYILVQLIKRGGEGGGGGEERVQTVWIQNICSQLSVLLANSKSHDLSFNLMGLVKNLLSVPSYSQYLIQCDEKDPSVQGSTKGSTFASAFKRVLLSNDEMLQLSSVQCVSTVLSHYSLYIVSLLRADIAEYLFEGLSVDNPKLIEASFNCLTLMAANEEFFTGCHVVYGFQPILNALQNTVLTRNIEGLKSGLHLLSNILQRQSSSLPLLSTNMTVILTILHSILSKIDQDTVYLHCAMIMKHLMSSQDVSCDVSLSVFLPHFSLLLQRVDQVFSNVLNDCEYEEKEDDSGVFENVLESLTNLTKVLYERKSPLENDNEIYVFIINSTEETLIPIAIGVFTDNECTMNSLYHLLTFLLKMDQLIENSLHQLPLTLAKSGFIELVMETRSKNSSEWSSQFIEELSYCMFTYHDSCFNTEEVNELKRILHLGLPDINCNLNDSMKFLTQRESHSHTTRPVQGSVLCLLYLTEVYVGISDKRLLLLISQYLSLHNDFHLLSPPLIKQLLFLYTTSKLSVGHSSTVIDDVLIKGLLKLPLSSSLFINNISLLVWAYEQSPLRGSLTKEWLQKWLMSSPPCYSKLLNSITDWMPLKDDLLLLLTSGVEECLNNVTLLLAQIIALNKVTQDEIIKSLEMFFLTHKFLTTRHQANALKLLCQIPLKDTIKLFCQVLSIVESTQLNGESVNVLVYGIQFICTNLHEANYISFIINNISLLRKVIDILHTPQQLSPSLLTISLKFITKLISNFSDGSDELWNKEGLHLDTTVLLQLLLHNDINVQHAAIGIWKALLNSSSQHVLTGRSDYHQSLAFILINIMAEDKNEEVLADTVDCFQALKYNLNTHFGDILSGDWYHFLNSFLTLRYTDTDIPSYFKQLT